ncbi:MAG: glycosyltransferase family 4 protein [Syntrophobacteraceae bacterium]
MDEQARLLPGTVVWIAPFFNRSGYGVGARATVAALHKAGAHIRILSNKEIDPGLDDCDLALFKSLEATPLIPPITAIISHLPQRIWLDLELPRPNLRIIATTFDSSEQGNLPPAEWMEVCKEMDQVWLMVEKEREAFISAGLAPEKIQLVHWPHPWLENPFVPPPTPEPATQEKPFRFLSIAMFQPRRRWDTLIEAYLEEFKGEHHVELYLKVNYPSWHPIPGKPRQDLLNLVGSLRQKTGSEAAIVIDENMGTRTGIVHLIDSCSVYISTDTASTSPISEARVRQRMVIIPDGLGLGRIGVCIAVDPHARSELSQEMLLYQPHHKGAFMPQLHVKDVRRAMRTAYDMTLDERQAIAAGALHVPGPTEAVPMVLKAISSGWEYKEASEKERRAKEAVMRIIWEGSQLVSHSLALVNREFCLQLIDAGCEVSIIPFEKDNIDPGVDQRFEKIVQRIHKPLSSKADVHFRQQWPPDFNPPPQGHWVMMQLWEYGRLPASWIEPMSNLVDELWVSSRHVLKTYIASGIPSDRVQVVPLGVNVDQFHPEAQKRSMESSKKFRFLFVGGGLWRKGVDLLLDAYRGTFSSRDDVVLVIKDLPQEKFYIDQGVGRIIRSIQKDPNAPEILHMQTVLEPGELPGLYTASDCLVHPYRAEGFGLPVLEAMACGVPVITTEGGSTDDFCSPGQVFLIPSRRREFNPKDIELAGGAGWVLEPDLSALKAHMREVFENNKVAKERALSVSEHVRSHHGWEEVSRKLIARINLLTQKPIRRKSGL